MSNLEREYNKRFHNQELPNEDFDVEGLWDGIEENLPPESKTLPKFWALLAMAVLVGIGSLMYFNKTNSSGLVSEKAVSEVPSSEESESNLSENLGGNSSNNNNLYSNVTEFDNPENDNKEAKGNERNRALNKESISSESTNRIAEECELLKQELNSLKEQVAELEEEKLGKTENSGLLIQELAALNKQLTGLEQNSINEEIVAPLKQEVVELNKQVAELENPKSSVQLGEVKTLASNYENSHKIQSKPKVEAAVNTVKAPKAETAVNTVKAPKAETEVNTVKATVKAPKAETEINTIKVPKEIENIITNTPITNTPITNTPITNTPITNTPITNTPITNTPITNTPITNTPITNTPITNTPITKRKIEKPFKGLSRINPKSIENKEKKTFKTLKVNIPAKVKSIDLPKLRRNNSFNYEIALLGGYTFTYFKFNSTDPNLNTILNDKNNFERPDWGIKLGVEASIYWEDKWMLKTGIEENRLWTRFEYENIETIPVTKENELVKVILTNNGDTLSTEYVDVVVNSFHTRKIVHHNRYHQISIPIELGITHNIGRFDLGCTAGIAFNKLTRIEGRTLDANGEIALFDTNTENLPLNANSLSWRLSPFVAFQASEKYAIKLQGQWIGQNHTGQQTNIKTIVNQYNAAIGISRRF